MKRRKKLGSYQKDRGRPKGHGTLSRGGCLKREHIKDPEFKIKRVPTPRAITNPSQPTSRIKRTGAENHKPRIFKSIEKKSTAGRKGSPSRERSRGLRSDSR